MCLVLLAIGLPATAASDIPPADIQRIINQANEQYSACRGGEGGTDPDTNPHCIKGRELFDSLEKLGWCYGHEGQYGYEKKWEPCGRENTANGPEYKEGDTLAGSPKIKPDGQPYQLVGGIKLMESENVAIAQLLTEQKYFKFQIPDQLRADFDKSARLNWPVYVAGRYIANSEVTTVLGQTLSVPVFMAEKIKFVPAN